jgi:hypothetical protein
MPLNRELTRMDTKKHRVGESGLSHTQKVATKHGQNSSQSAPDSRPFAASHCIGTA